jgi:uncharacterized protein
MSLSKFHLTKQNKNILVCNQTNHIFNEDGTYVITPSKPITFEGYNERGKTNKPIRLRIILGHACNYSCSYCSQKDTGNPHERNKNKNLFDFIVNFDQYIDRSELQKVELWGGEPFLYWQDMMELMKFFDNEKIEFYISTNGSTLMPKHVEFFKTLKGNVGIGISHDGPGQETLRGTDIFDIDRVCDVVKLLDDSYPKLGYSFNFVLTNKNYDLFSINSYFKNIAEKLNLKHINLGFEIGRTYGQEIPEDYHYSFSYENVINGDNLEIFKNTSSEYFKQLIQKYSDEFNGIQHNSDLINCNLLTGENYGTSIISTVQQLLNGTFISATSNCGSDWNRSIDLDINGDIRTCQGTDSAHISGNISKIEETSLYRLNLDRNTGNCDTCQVKLLCKRSCPLPLSKQSFDRNCGVEKVWYTEILLAALNIVFDDEVVLVES